MTGDVWFVWHFGVENLRGSATQESAVLLSLHSLFLYSTQEERYISSEQINEEWWLKPTACLAVDAVINSSYTGFGLNKVFLSVRAVFLPHYGPFLSSVGKFLNPLHGHIFYKYRRSENCWFFFFFFVSQPQILNQQHFNIWSKVKWKKSVFNSSSTERRPLFYICI